MADSLKAPIQMQQYVTPSKAANLLGVSKNTVVNWLDSGKLEGQRTVLGRTVKLSSIEKVLKERA
jgi:excisionase family DNA binding protein